MTPADLRQRVEAATPGPWRNEGRFVGALKIKVVAEVPEGGIYHGKVDAANTRLIALAPDLALALADAWEALEFALRHEPKKHRKAFFEEEGGEPQYPGDCGWCDVRRVLAKLEGLEAGGKS